MLPWSTAKQAASSCLADSSALFVQTRQFLRVTSVFVREARIPACKCCTMKYRAQMCVRERLLCGSIWSRIGKGVSDPGPARGGLSRDQASPRELCQAGGESNSEREVPSAQTPIPLIGERALKGGPREETGGVAVGREELREPG